MHREMHNRSALVTGASSGIGWAVMSAYARAGMSVHAADVGDIDLTPLDDEARQRIVTFKVDVRCPSDMERVSQSAVDRFGRLDIVAAVAGISKTGPVMNMSLAERDEVLDVNFNGVWNTVAAALPFIVESPGPRRVLVCGSLASVVGGPGQAAYGASKHAVVGFVKALAMEHAKDNVTANVISPGGVATPMLSEFMGSDGEPSAAAQRFVATTPLGRFATVDEVASLFEYVASPAAGYMTGENIVMDGGCNALNVHSLDLVRQVR